MVNTENVPSISITLKPLYYRPLRIPSAVWVPMQSTNRGFFQSSENNLFFPVTSSSGFITVYTNNNRLWFHSNANQRERRERARFNLRLCYLIQVLTKIYPALLFWLTICLNKTLPVTTCTKSQNMALWKNTSKNSNVIFCGITREIANSKGTKLSNETIRRNKKPHPLTGDIWGFTNY